MRRSELTALSKLLAGTAFLATIFVTPWYTIDPINVPKLGIISLGGFMCLGVVITNRKFLSQARFRTTLVCVLLFILDLFLVFFIAGTNPTQEFFGAYGRSTGLLAYLSLSLLFVAAVVGYSDELLEKIKRALLLAGAVSLLYGLIQVLGMDPIKWANQYSPVIGFLGNPNFQSSFLGLSAVLSLALMLGALKNPLILFGYATYQLVSLFVIVKTNSQQGLLVFAGGAGVVLVLWIRTTRFKFLAIPVYVISVCGFVFLTLGSLNSGPLASLLYKDSVTYRGDYWRAGVKMGLENPIFGVGLDSYGDWYRRARSVEATLRRGPEITSNAAHNVVIDFFAYGGFPLAIIYLSLMFLVLRSCYLVIKRANTYNPAFIGLVAVWVAYQAQSIISLNQLGLAVWGWIISGLIIVYEINSRDKQGGNEVAHAGKGKSAIKNGKEELAPLTVVGTFLGLVAGAVLVMPIVIASSKHKSALGSGRIQSIIDVAYRWPTDPLRMGQVALILQENKLGAESLTLITEATKKFPSEFKIWQILAQAPNATKAQVAEAKLQMKRLDPNNPNLK
jgi:hypothetical protein